MKVALITDQHFGARNDSVVFDNFFKKFYNECFFPEIDKRGIKTIFCLGDTFDRRKYISFNTLKNCRDYWFDEIKKRNIQLIMIVGNHDTTFKNTNDVNSPHLLLNDYDNITIYTNPTEYGIDGTSILLMPWICTENYNESMEAIKETKAQILFGHFEIAGFQMYKGHANDEGFNPKMFDKFDMVFSGHFHHRSSNGNIHYLGNPYEITWADYDDTRGFHIFDTSTRELEFIKNPFNIFTKFHYDDQALDIDNFDVSIFSNQHVKILVINKTDFYKFDKFIERVYSVNPHELKIIEDYSSWVADDTGEEIDVDDTVTLLNNYVDAVEIDANKERIKNIMKTLYLEAQNYEE